MGLLQSNYKGKNLLIAVVRGAIVRKKNTTGDQEDLIFKDLDKFF
jgi:hypothetical protein